MGMVYPHSPAVYIYIIYIHMYVYQGTFADPHKATSKGRWDWSENSAGTPNQRAFKLSVGGLPTKWRNKHLKHSPKRTNAILKLGTVFDTHGLRPSRGQQQLNQSQKISISKGNLNKFLGDVGGLPRWRTGHLEHL